MFFAQGALCRMVVFLFLFAWTLPISAESLYVKKDRETIHVRLIAREAPSAITAFGNNVDAYIVELVRKPGDSQLARLSFRFLSYQASLPDSFRDYAVVHTFNAVRDQECDVSVAQVASHPLQYSASAPPLRAGDSVLPCYVVTPKDYKGSKRDHNAKRVVDSNMAGAADVSLRTKVEKGSAHR